jgi:hypothetical protein
VYTKRCLGLTQEITLQLFKQPLALVQLLADVLGWTTLLMAIVVSCLLGITVFVSLLRTYQHSAVLPSTTCGESYGRPSGGCSSVPNYRAAGLGVLLRPSTVSIIVPPSKTAAHSMKEAARSATSSTSWSTLYASRSLLEDSAC